MKKFIKENWFKLGILFVLLIISSSVFSYLSKKNEQYNIQKVNVGILLQNCLDKAKTDSENSFWNYCQTSGEYKDATQCPYQLPIGGTMLTAYEADRDACFKQFPQN